VPKIRKESARYLNLMLPSLMETTTAV
jgi:hypothetical protein